VYVVLERGTAFVASIFVMLTLHPCVPTAKYAHMLKFDLKAKMSKDIVDALKASDRPRFEVR
jgi:hypothetical protein